MLQHVSLEVRASDAAACVEFWRILGFLPVAVPEPLAGTTAWLECGHTQVHLLFTERPVTPSRAHCAVVAEDYRATVERLRAAGFECEPRREHWGAPRCFVHDPAHHRVEVMAAPPPPQGGGSR